MDLSSVTELATPTASPRRVSRSRCCFYSSTNVCADHSPTATSTTSPTQNIAQTVSSKPHTSADKAINQIVELLAAAGALHCRYQCQSRSVKESRGKNLMSAQAA